jgi:hypothetical protein
MGEEEKFEDVTGEIAAEKVAIEVVKGEAANVGFTTVARAKARMKAYESIYGNYEKYIAAQAEHLAGGLFDETPYKELGVARLISMWLVESEAFFKECEPLLAGIGQRVRRGFMEESFEQLPQEIKDRLLREFNLKKQELLVWFVNVVQVEIQKGKG